MSRPVAAPDVVVTAPADAPVILSGTPTRLRGRLSVRNDGPERASLRGFTLASHDLPQSPGPGQIGARLLPGTPTDVIASLALPAATPAGKYHATLDVAGRQIESIVVVVDDPALELTPSRVYLDTHTTTLRLVVRNTGNVRLDIAPVARARLRSDPDLDALPGRRKQGADDDAASDADAVLRLANASAVEPGEVAVLDAQIEVDDRADRERRHLALLPVATATLRVIVGPRPDAASSLQPTAEPATRRTRAPRRKDA